MHAVIDFRAMDETTRSDEDALPFVVDQDMAALIRVNTRSWRQRNGLEPEQSEAQ
jgi:hypothetical protein